MKAKPTPRHQWSAPWRPSEYLTERKCQRCGLRRITRHDAGLLEIPWYEFRDTTGTLVTFGGTPPCEPVETGDAA